MKRMKRALITTIAAALLLVGVSRAAQATEVGYGRKFGIGFVLGDPTGVSAKWWIGGTNALDAGLGFWGFGVNNQCFRDNNNNVVCPGFGGGGTLNVDYLWQSNIVRGQAQLDWHVGFGGRAIFWNGCAGDCVAIGARGPIGLDLMFNNPSFLEVFFEIAPAFYIVPGVGFTIEGGLGVRFYI
jgi:hypothetical protein